MINANKKYEEDEDLLPILYFYTPFNNSINIPFKK